MDRKYSSQGYGPGEPSIQSLDWTGGLDWWTGLVDQARRQGGFEGVRSNPLFGLQKILYTPLNYTLSTLPFEIGPLASMLLRITAVKTSLVAATGMRVYSWRTSAERARKLFTPLR